MAHPGELQPVIFEKDGHGQGAGQAPRGFTVASGHLRTYFQTLPSTSGARTVAGMCASPVSRKVYL